jgi:glycerate dehydrogenase
VWGIVGAGNIGGKVAEVARALGCQVIVYKRTPDDRYECTDLDTLMSKSDIISVHLPLSDSTRNIIDSERISMMKKDAIIVNVARGSVWDESAVADAVENGRIGGMGCDVYSLEPMSSEHPFNRIMHRDNVCLTPHMAWGSFESRSRCISTMAKNIECYFNGEIYNRVDI